MSYFYRFVSYLEGVFSNKHRNLCSILRCSSSFSHHYKHVIIICLSKFIIEKVGQTMKMSVNQWSFLILFDDLRAGMVHSWVSGSRPMKPRVLLGSFKRSHSSQLHGPCWGHQRLRERKNMNESLCVFFLVHLYFLPIQDAPGSSCTSPTQVHNESFSKKALVSFKSGCWMCSLLLGYHFF